MPSPEYAPGSNAAIRRDEEAHREEPNEAVCRECGCRWDATYDDKGECPYCGSTDVEVPEDG